MSHSHSTKGNRRYRYYVCQNAQKRGWDKCPSKSVPAGEIEAFVVDQLRGVVREADLVEATLAELRRQVESQIESLNLERRGIKQDLQRGASQMRALATEPDTDRQADLLEQVRLGEQRLREINNKIERLRADEITEAEITAAIEQFDPVWESLSPREQGRVVSLLIQQVDYDGQAGTVAVTYRPAGFRELALEESLA